MEKNNEINKREDFVKKVYQTKFGKPEGNCFSACIASILEVGIDDVPCYHEDKGVWYRKYQQWLRSYKLDFVAISDWQGEGKEVCPNVYSIVGGISPRNLPHSVVYFGLDMVHDPHPEGGGVRDITEWIYLVPMFPERNIQEKDVRIKYQSIVYKICSLFDTAKEKCTIDEVVDRVKKLKDRR